MASFLFVPAAFAQDAAEIVRQFKGDAPSPPRSAEQWQAAADLAVAHLAGPMGSPEIKAHAPAEQSLQSICNHVARPGAEAERLAVCRAIAARLTADTPPRARVWMMRQLERIGSVECVDALSAQLADGAVREPARRALQANPSPRAGDVLRAALAKADERDWQVALINALGARGESASAAPLIELIKSDVPAVVFASADALVAIGDASAIAPLQAARGRAGKGDRELLAHALLRLADARLAAGDAEVAAGVFKKLYVPSESPAVRAAALRGLMAARRDGAAAVALAAMGKSDDPVHAAAVAYVRQTGGPEMTAALVAAFDDAEAATRVLILDVLAGRSDPAARPLAVRAVAGDDATVRLAGLRALAATGTHEDVELLAMLAASRDAPTRTAARDALVTLPGPTIDRAILARAKSAAGPPRHALVAALADRCFAPSADWLAELAAGPDSSDRLAALAALKVLGTQAHVPALAKRVAAAESQRERGVAGDALTAAVARAEKPAGLTTPIADELAAADPSAGAILLRALGLVGDDAALAAVRTQLADEKLRDAAVRVLADWPAPAAAGDLLTLAASADSNIHRVLALRGYIRLAGLSAPGEQLAMYRRAMPLATRPPERRAVLSGLGKLSDPAALKVVLPLVGDQHVDAEAATAAVALAERVAAGHPAAARAAGERVVEKSSDKSAVVRAKKLLGELPPPDPAAGHH